MTDDTRKPRILIVEDDEFSQDFISGALDTLAEVSIANSGEQALQKLSDTGQLPDLVVVDIVMYAMNGIEITRYIRHDLSEYKIPVFVLSSHADAAMERIAYSAGATVVCKKGLSSQALLQRIRGLLDISFNPHS
ncbi:MULTISPECIES: response regulator [unclassified Marinobacterium]|jgi:CheY-like chemotaxis protein|uniref:response regulator n=1 Tax=unclassified Marinobacterium TaxID=2644139 RepID=UPI0015694B6D|nr:MULTISPECIES: response regulator [unclassified Marinobacterium]NRP16318.1 Sensor histidine kinase TodS [Marinobacterium sp. xm-a-152]NRQ02794.1 Sensor histidine kinase TodS [Marinobacterium sp. xm-d-530]